MHSHAAVPLMEIREAPGVFADALLRDERGGLLFLSLWGRDTALQELLARITLKSSEGGVTVLHVTTRLGEAMVDLDRIACLDRHSGRLSPRNLFGDIAQVWLYDKLATDPDRANRRGLLFFTHRLVTDEVGLRFWQLIREISHLPLLDHWRKPVMAMANDAGWIRQLSGDGVNALVADLGDPRFEGFISEMIRNEVLTLDESRSTSQAQLKAA